MPISIHKLDRSNLRKGVLTNQWTAPQDPFLSLPPTYQHELKKLVVPVSLSLSISLSLPLSLPTHWLALSRPLLQRQVTNNDLTPFLKILILTLISIFQEGILVLIDMSSIPYPEQTSNNREQLPFSQAPFRNPSSVKASQCLCTRFAKQSVSAHINRHMTISS